MNRLSIVIKVLFFSIFLNYNLNCQAQDVDYSLQNDKIDSNAIYTKVETLPEFPGGMMGFYAYVSQSYNVPPAFKGAGNLILTFVVEKDGSLTDIKTVRDLGSGTGEEAVRILKLSPKWKPGIQDGVPVRVNFTLPLKLSKN